MDANVDGGGHTSAHTMAHHKMSTGINLHWYASLLKDITLSLLPASHADKRYNFSKLTLTDYMHNLHGCSRPARVTLARQSKSAINVQNMSADYYYKLT